MAQVDTIKEKEVISIETVDIDKVNKFRGDFANVTAKMGEIEVEMINAEMVMKNIKEAKEQFINEYKELRASEQKLTDEFKEKYGIGEFDLEKAIFTPNA